MGYCSTFQTHISRWMFLMVRYLTTQILSWPLFNQQTTEESIHCIRLSESQDVWRVMWWRGIFYRPDPYIGTKQTDKALKTMHYNRLNVVRNVYFKPKI